MTDGKKKRGHKLSHEILGLLAATLLISIFLFQLLSMCGIAIANGYCADRDIILTEGQLAELDNWIFHLSLLTAVSFFVILFLFLLGERLAYILDIIKGIDALRAGRSDYVLASEGNNELTRLAEAVNYLSASQREIKERERALSEEREQLIRTLSHDIRTPLTSILSYSEFLAGENGCAPRQREEHLALIRQKAGQIKELTDLLLEGGQRNVERFADGRLLMGQLAAELEETLDGRFPLSADLDSLPPFEGSFDVGELRRVFDNLASNILKYAAPDEPVTLSIGRREGGPLVIRQQNRRRADGAARESHGLGLISIRRIAHNYGGRVEAREDGDLFAITIELSEF